MRKITLFTLLYLAWGICLTVITLQHTDLMLNSALTLWIVIGITDLFALLSTFPFWRQWLLRSQQIMRNKPVWRQTLLRITPWIVLMLVIVTLILDLMKHQWTPATVWQTSLGVTFIILISEQIYLRSQTQSNTSL